MRAYSRVIAAGLVAGAFLVFALVNAGNGEAPTSNPEGRVELLEPYDSSFINLWVGGCVSSGETEAFCRCAINEYTTRLQPYEFETAAAVGQSGGQVSELPEHLRDVVKGVERDCR